MWHAIKLLFFSFTHYFRQVPCADQLLDQFERKVIISFISNWCNNNNNKNNIDEIFCHGMWEDFLFFYFIKRGIDPYYYYDADVVDDDDGDEEKEGIRVLGLLSLLPASIIMLFLFFSLSLTHFAVCNLFLCCVLWFDCKSIILLCIRRFMAMIFVLSALFSCFIREKYIK